MHVKFLSLLVVGAIGCAFSPTGGFETTDANADVKLDAQRRDARVNVPDADAPEVSFNLWPSTPEAMQYRGGPVMLGTPSVYFIWYGNWTGSQTPDILTNLIKNMSSTAYYRMNSGFYEIPGNQAQLDAGLADADAGSKPMLADAGDAAPSISVYVSDMVNFAREISVGYSHGMQLHQGDVPKIVAEAITSNALPADPNGAYFVLTSSDVSEHGAFLGFCSDYCGYHEHVLIDGIDIKYSFVGDPSGCLDACSIQSSFLDAGIANSPNGNWGADSMASVMCHELSEMVTDPDPSEGTVAWQDGWGYENGDKCAWRFDPTYPTLNGSRANVNFGGHDYIVQQLWVIMPDGGYCALQAAPGNP